MKKLYSIVLMATALLIGTNAWATSYDDIQDAIKNAAAGSEVNITLTSNVTVTKPIQIYGKKIDEGKTVNINLSGFNITSASGAVIELYKGTLNLIGAGQIATTATNEAIKVFGANEDVADWSVLNIGSGVTVSSSQNAISVLGFYGKNVYRYMNAAGATAGYTGKALDGTNGALDFYVENDTYLTYKQGTTIKVSANALAASGDIDYTTSYPSYKTAPVSGKTYHDYSGENTMAYGVKIEVSTGAVVAGEKYGIKINGTIRYNGTNLPYVHVAKDAEVRTNPTAKNATAIYSSGYGNIVIEGNVHGSTGVYVKAGNVTVEEGATIKSDNNTGNGTEAIGKGSGINAGGNAIAIEGDNAAYSSNGISVEINGGTITAGTNGYAVQNVNNTTTPSEETTKAVVIAGGEFEGGAAGCVTIDNSKGNVDVELEGGTFTGNIETLIAATGDENKIIQEVVAQEGGQATVVIGTREAGDDVEQPATPQEKQDFAFVNDMSNDIVKLDATTANIAKTLPAGTTEVKYLSLTGTGAYTSTVTVEAGKTLKVGQIVMNANGRIIVEAGATLIVSGANGIFADDIENLVLKASQDAQAIFLLNPGVKSNKHPYATVEFISKSWRKADGSALAWQRFGIPSFGALTEITATAPTAFARFNKETNEWESIGILGTMDLNNMATPFEYYQMLNNNPDMGTVVTMKGQLYGNESPELAIRGNFWNGFSNSYMAPINGSQLLNLIPSTVDKAFYLNKIDGNQASWESVTSLNIIMGLMDDIKPMQPFLIRNTKEAADVTVDYAQAVYNPATSAPNAAPARRDENLTFVKIGIQGAEGFDRILVAEGADFSAEFDNGYDAVKFMNEDINLYVSAAEKMGNFATDDLNNTYVGLQTVKGGNYTIEFANVQGEELILIDHETGAQVAMVEGATYEFTAAANSTNDYRFEIVEPAKLPTAIENAEAVKSAKGIYTITGQYVGEMSVWNTLPAGIYVVNGEKLVK